MQKGPNKQKNKQTNKQSTEANKQKHKRTKQKHNKNAEGRRETLQHEHFKGNGPFQTSGVFTTNKQTNKQANKHPVVVLVGFWIEGRAAWFLFQGGFLCFFVFFVCLFFFCACRCRLACVVADAAAACLRRSVSSCSTTHKRTCPNPMTYKQ